MLGIAILELMARISPYEHLKPEIFALIDEGRKTSEICAAFPAIPTATVYVWAKEYRLHGAPVSRKGEGDSRIVEAPPTKPHLVSVAPQNVEPLSPVDGPSLREELRQVRRWLWKQMRSPSEDSAVQFQGANAYLRAIQVEMGLPDDDEQLTDAERAGRITQLLAAARERRTG